MAALWSAIVLLASPFSLHLAVDESVPSWVQEHWQYHGEKLAGAYADLFAISPDYTVRIVGTRVSNAPQQLNISAYADQGTIHIRLDGQGWTEPSATARRILVQNIAHELGHIWQGEIYTSMFEPRWLHEGFAQTLSLAALDHSDVWTARDIAAFRTDMDADCATVLAQGPLIAAFEREDQDAIYACSFVILDVAGTAARMSATELYQYYSNSRSKSQGLGKALVAALPLGYLGQLHRFIYSDYSATDGVRIIRALRSGLL